MSQFDLFAAPVEVPTPPAKTVQARRKPTAEPVKLAIPQPPAIIRAGTELPPNPLGLKPLLTIPDEWLEVTITEEEFAARRLDFGPECSDDFVMLGMLEALGIRCKPREVSNMQELYGWVDGPAVMRRRTLPGIAVTVRQAPKEEPCEK